jgi:hypothetical protein
MKRVGEAARTLFRSTVALSLKSVVAQARQIFDLAGVLNHRKRPSRSTRGAAAFADQVHTKAASHGFEPKE